MFDKRETEVLVVGAGPVGLFAAMALDAKGVGVQIIDAEWRPAAHAYALALHPRSLELLDGLGMAASLVEHGTRVSKVVYFDGTEKAAEVSLAELGGRFPYVLVMPQSVLEQSFADRLAQRKIKVLWNHRVSELVEDTGGTIALVDKWDKEPSGYAAQTMEKIIAKTYRTRFDLAVAADGHHSTMRRLSGIGFERVADPDQYAVFEFETDVDLGGELRVVVTDGLASVLWPLPGGRCRWSFQLAKEDEVDAERPKSRLSVQIGERVFPHLTVDYLTHMIETRAPWFKGAIGDVNWSLIVRFERRLASCFGAGRVWLAGDSGHLCGPAGVQSMNIGLREASDLAERFAGVLKGGQPLSVLEQYDAERRAEWRRMLGLEGGLTPTDAATPWVRANAGTILASLPASGANLQRLAAQVGLA